MYVDTCRTGKYIRHLLRESYREGGKVKHRTIANLSDCAEEEINAIRLALQHKHDLVSHIAASDFFSTRQGLSVGSVWLVNDIARQLGISDALGPSRDGKLALWQVIARVIDQGSRLSAVRLAGSHAACDILGIGSFNEDHLYANLDWLCNNQADIEYRLFKVLYPETPPRLFLYDVTSTYLEGEFNELAAFGYNRDKKKGKMQIVVGLLCDEWGRPLSIEAFTGNTQDTATFDSQVRKAAERFGCSEVTFVGDRGMIKSRQIEELAGRGFHYITAITRAQIETLLSKDIIQMELFDSELAEVETEKELRYILRRNPLRAEEIHKSREQRFDRVWRELKIQNEYLATHSRAKGEVALNRIIAKIVNLKLSEWMSCTLNGRTISLSINQEALVESMKLDGCYALKTDLPKKDFSKEIIHDRYKDLARVEWAFRISKTVELEMRPVNVRNANRTRGHALVVMLAYRIVLELSKRWHDIELTVEEAINELSSLCATEILVDGKPRCNDIPQPRPSVEALLSAARVRLPEALPCSGTVVATRRKIVKNRRNP